jgi:predicted nucleic acid-binding protein
MNRSSVFISDLPDSPPARILEMILIGTVQLIISPGIIQALSSVFTYPKLKKS